MNKMDYANEVARLVGGEVEIVEKANGIKAYGVKARTGSNINAVVYIDDDYRNDIDPRMSADRVRVVLDRHAMESIDVTWMSDYSKVKPMLRARLYNEATSADVFKSAADYGFDDLVIIPYIDGVIENGSVKVTAQMLETWGIDGDTVIQDAENNSRHDAYIKSMFEMLGLPGTEDAPMWVVTSGAFGAYAVITKMDELKERFPDGFTVLPSSLHEVIVVPMADPAFDEMVQEVNDTEVDPLEQLSNHAYRIAT